eukprot:scaffold3767_cov114-Isochrysis_galbana.AAC.40
MPETPRVEQRVRQIPRVEQRLRAAQLQDGRPKIGQQRQSRARRCPRYGPHPLNGGRRCHCAGRGTGRCDHGVQIGRSSSRCSRLTADSSVDPGVATDAPAVSAAASSARVRSAPAPAPGVATSASASGATI